MMRGFSKFAIVAGIGFGLLACSSANSDYLQLGSVIYDQLRTTVGDDSIPRAKAAAVPFATMGARIGGSAETMMVLSTITGKDRLWLDAARAGITTRDGRVVRTVGLEHNLDGFQAASDSTTSGTGSTTVTRHYLYDLWDKGIFGLSVVCNESDVGTESIRIIGVRYATRHIVETCRAAQIDWDFKNEFWADATTGYVWKSRQHIHPDLSALTLEILRRDQG